MKITYYVGQPEDLFRKHAPVDSLQRANRLTFGGNYCFVYSDDIFVFSFALDEMWLEFKQRKGSVKLHFYSCEMHKLFTRWVRLKLCHLQRAGTEHEA
jgi:hypothetical protein